MLGQPPRAHKLPPSGLAASTSGTSAGEFHTVRLQETERTRAVKELGAQEARSQVGPSFFVPSLQAICADTLAQNFTTTPDIDALQHEHAELYEMIVERLPVAVLPEEEKKPQPNATITTIGRPGPPSFSGTTPSTTAAASPYSPSAPGACLPLNVAVARVVSEAYWKRCCMARWSAGQLSQFTGGGKPLLEKQYGWKRLFLEHVLSNFLMSLRSGSGQDGAGSSSVTRARADARLSTDALGASPQGRTHSIGAPSFISSTHSSIAAASGGSGEFQPSQLSEEDARALAELCALCRDYVHTVELPCQYTHLHWYEHLFSRLPGILNFRLSYGTTNVGVGYDKAMLGFTDDDADSVRHLLSRYTSLEALRLPQNRLTNAQALMMSSGLVGNTRLRVLDLSRNALDDVAVTEGIALLLCQPEFPLQELNLSDNGITAVGAKALAEALAVNRTLVLLNLSQNRIGDADGGTALVRALGQNPLSPLRELHVGNNLLSVETVAALREVLPGLRTLSALNLAGNRRIGSHAGDGDGRVGAGDALCEAVLANTSLRFIDVRFCNLSTEQVATMEAAVQGRVERVALEERNAKDAEQRARIAELVASRPSGRY